MKNIILSVLGLTIIYFQSCKEDLQDKVLFSQSFVEKNQEWQTSSDTMTKAFDIGFETIKEPIKISWIVAKDKSGCLRISYVKLENTNKTSNIKLKNIKLSKIDCAMKFDSPDTTRFETLVLSAEYSASKAIKQHNYKGSLITIMGNGESIITKDQL